MDLRERIVAARLAGASVESVARRFGVCTKTVRVYQARAAAGKLPPTPRPGRAPSLSPEQEGVLLALVQEQPGATLAELGEALHKRTGVLLPRSTLHDHLKRRGVRYKKRVVAPKNAVK